MTGEGGAPFNPFSEEAMSVAYQFSPEDAAKSFMKSLETFKVTDLISVLSNIEKSNKSEYEIKALIKQAYAILEKMPSLNLFDDDLEIKNDLINSEHNLVKAILHAEDFLNMPPAEKEVVDGSFADVDWKKNREKMKADRALELKKFSESSQALDLFEGILVTKDQLISDLKKVGDSTSTNKIEELIKEANEVLLQVPAINDLSEGGKKRLAVLTKKFTEALTHAQAVAKRRIIGREGKKTLADLKEREEIGTDREKERQSVDAKIAELIPLKENDNEELKKINKTLLGLYKELKAFLSPGNSVKQEILVEIRAEIERMEEKKKDASPPEPVVQEEEISVNSEPEPVQEIEPEADQVEGVGKIPASNAIELYKNQGREVVLSGEGNQSNKDNIKTVRIGGGGVNNNTATKEVIIDADLEDADEPNEEVFGVSEVVGEGSVEQNERLETIYKNQCEAKLKQKAKELLDGKLGEEIRSLIKTNYFQEASWRLNDLRTKLGIEAIGEFKSLFEDESDDSLIIFFGDKIFNLPDIKSLDDEIQAGLKKIEKINEGYKEKEKEALEKFIKALAGKKILSAWVALSNIRFYGQLSLTNKNSGNKIYDMGNLETSFKQLIVGLDESIVNRAGSIFVSAEAQIGELGIEAVVAKVRQEITAGNLAVARQLIDELKEKFYKISDLIKPESTDFAENNINNQIMELLYQEVSWDQILLLDKELAEKEKKSVTNLAEADKITEKAELSPTRQRLNMLVKLVMEGIINDASKITDVLNFTWLDLRDEQAKKDAVGPARKLGRWFGRLTGGNRLQEKSALKIDKKNPTAEELKIDEVIDLEKEEKLSQLRTDVDSAKEDFARRIKDGSVIVANRGLKKMGVAIEALIGAGANEEEQGALKKDLSDAQKTLLELAGGFGLKTIGQATDLVGEKYKGIITPTRTEAVHIKELLDGGRFDEAKRDFASLKTKVGGKLVELDALVDAMPNSADKEKVGDLIDKDLGGFKELEEEIALMLSLNFN